MLKTWYATKPAAVQSVGRSASFVVVFCYVVLFLIIVMSWQNWLADGTGSQGDPALYEEYLERMEEMKEEMKNK